MAATYRVDVFHTAGPTSGAWPAGGLLHRADTDPTTAGAATPVPVPAAGSNYSWRKSFKLNVTVTPSGAVTNLRWFSDGVSVGTGLVVLAKNTASYTLASSADETVALGSSVDATTLTSASPMTVNAGTVLSNPSTGFGTQNYVEMQLQVGTTAGPGVTALRTYSYRVDET